MGNLVHAKARFPISGADAERQAEAAQFFFPHSEERYMPPPRHFRSGKGAWLGSRQNPTKTSGCLDKIDYEKLIDIVSQNGPL